MKKETIIAISFGVILGGIVAIFILMKSKESQMNKTKTVSPSITVTPKVSPKSTSSQILEITEPRDNSIAGKNNITIKGKAPKGTFIIVQSQIKEVVVKNDKDTFSFEFPLALGLNVINVTSYAKNMQTKIQEKEINIYYLDEKL